MCVFWTGSFQCEDRAIDRAERRKKLGREVNDFLEELPLKWGGCWREVCLGRAISQDTCYLSFDPRIEVVYPYPECLGQEGFPIGGFLDCGVLA